MQRLRQIHLYLGCVFAPMLAFFALSGLWQNYFFRFAWGQLSDHPRIQHALALISTLHTARSLKISHLSSLSSVAMVIFTSAMALSLLVTMALGVLMAFRFGHRRVALACLAAGVVLPLSIIAVTLR